MITIKHLQINQISALDNSLGVDLPLNKLPEQINSLKSIDLESNPQYPRTGTSSIRISLVPYSGYLWVFSVILRVSTSI